MARIRTIFGHRGWPKNIYIYGVTLNSYIVDFHLTEQNLKMKPNRSPNPNEDGTPPRPPPMIPTPAQPPTSRRTRRRHQRLRRRGNLLDSFQSSSISSGNSNNTALHSNSNPPSLSSIAGQDQQAPPRETDTSRHHNRADMSTLLERTLSSRSGNVQEEAAARINLWQRQLHNPEDHASVHQSRGEAMLENNASSPPSSMMGAGPGAIEQEQEQEQEQQNGQPGARQAADDQHDHGGDEDNDTPVDGDGWVECWDDVMEAIYYYNTITGEASWIHPDD